MRVVVVNDKVKKVGDLYEVRPDNPRDPWPWTVEPSGDGWMVRMPDGTPWDPDDPQHRGRTPKRFATAEEAIAAISEAAR